MVLRSIYIVCVIYDKSPNVLVLIHVHVFFTHKCLKARILLIGCAVTTNEK